jgi:hypothetical protein
MEPSSSNWLAFFIAVNSNHPWDMAQEIVEDLIMWECALFIRDGSDGAGTRGTPSSRGEYELR